MNWLVYVGYFFGGAFLGNALPHWLSGVQGRLFQSPFAKPPGEGLSSSTVNVIWGACNVVVGFLLICRIGDFDLHSNADVIVAGAGALVISLFHARHFGKFHGGDLR